MKKNYWFIILASTILGILIGTVVKDYNTRDIQHTYKDNTIRKEIRASKKSIKSLKKEMASLDKELISLKETTLKSEYKKEQKKIEDLKMDLSYTDIKGSGITINIDAVSDNVGNIAGIMDANKIFINIVNDLRVNGARYISINNKRINQYSSIVLAGNHINIGLVPIAQPYKIECIGDENKLSNYLKNKEEYLKGLTKNYPLKIESKIDKNLKLKKLEVPNEPKYLESE